MSSALTWDALKTQVGSGEVDTVLVCFVDMQGCLLATLGFEVPTQEGERDV
jgi:hypothetical protein